MQEFEATKALVINILENWQKYDWQYQGFGMLRIYIKGIEDWRLNIWDPEFAIPNVSTIHNHPWNLESLIVIGSLVNQRFIVQTVQGSNQTVGKKYSVGQIQPGPDGGMLTRLPGVYLLLASTEHYKAGDTYSQVASEIHRSIPTKGTVTLNRRTRRGEDKALVYWPANEDWVDAKPRPAVLDEVRAMTKAALSW